MRERDIYIYIYIAAGDVLINQICEAVVSSDSTKLIAIGVPREDARALAQG